MLTGEARGSSGWLPHLTDQFVQICKYILLITVARSKISWNYFHIRTPLSHSYDSHYMKWILPICWSKSKTKITVIFNGAPYTINFNKNFSFWHCWEPMSDIRVINMRNIHIYIRHYFTEKCQYWFNLNTIIFANKLMSSLSLCVSYWNSQPSLYIKPSIIINKQVVAIFLLDHPLLNYVHKRSSYNWKATYEVKNINID